MMLLPLGKSEKVPSQDTYYRDFKCNSKTNQKLGLHLAAHNRVFKGYMFVYFLYMQDHIYICIYISYMMYI